MSWFVSIPRQIWVINGCLTKWINSCIPYIPCMPHRVLFCMKNYFSISPIFYLSPIFNEVWHNWTISLLSKSDSFCVTNFFFFTDFVIFTHFQRGVCHKLICFIPAINQRYQRMPHQIKLSQIMLKWYEWIHAFLYIPYMPRQLFFVSTIILLFHLFFYFHQFSTRCDIIWLFHSFLSVCVCRHCFLLHRVCNFTNSQRRDWQLCSLKKKRQ